MTLPAVAGSQLGRWQQISIDSRYAAPPAIDRCLLTMPELSSKPAGRLCCCRSTGQTDGRTPCRNIDPNGSSAMPTILLKQGRRDDMPPPMAVRSKNRGGSKSVRGRVRSPHISGGRRWLSCRQAACLQPRQLRHGTDRRTNRAIALSAAACGNALLVSVNCSARLFVTD